MNSRLTQKELQKLVNKWDVSYEPKFRRPHCADCGCVLWFRMWHVFLKEFGNKREIHLCGRCGRKWNL